MISPFDKTTLFKTIFTFVAVFFPYLLLLDSAQSSYTDKMVEDDAIKKTKWLNDISMLFFTLLKFLVSKWSESRSLKQRSQR